MKDPRTRARSWVGLALVFALAGCDAEPAPPPSSSGRTDASPSTRAPADECQDVTRLPRRVTSAVRPSRGLPESFPTDLDGLVEFEAAPDARAWLTYRPREVLRDGVGWSTETIALWQGSWTRLSLGRLGIPARLWPGGDMLSAGALDDTGTKLAFQASSGVIVVNLTTGGWESYLDNIGGVGSIRWYPGGRRFVADPWKGPDKVVNVETGRAIDSAAPTLGLGFRDDGSPVTVRRAGEIDRVRDTDELELADLPACSLQRGRYFRSWWAGDRVAYANYEAVAGRYALRVANAATGEPVATLTWSRRTATYLQIHGWWDDRRLLLSMDKSLVTWSPETGAISRAARLPASDIRGQHASVGITFPQPRPVAPDHDQRSSTDRSASALPGGVR